MSETLGAFLAGTAAGAVVTGVVIVYAIGVMFPNIRVRR